jgi:hypothetical protein
MLPQAELDDEARSASNPPNPPPPAGPFRWTRPGSRSPQVEDGQDTNHDMARRRPAALGLPAQKNVGSDYRASFRP